MQRLGFPKGSWFVSNLVGLVCSWVGHTVFSSRWLAPVATPQRDPTRHKMTPELEKELRALRLRANFDPKRPPGDGRAATGLQGVVGTQGVVRRRWWCIGVSGDVTVSCQGFSGFKLHSNTQSFECTEMWPSFDGVFV